MSHHRYGVGIVGLQPGRSWAARAHLPALRALADDFELVGVANTSLESAQAAAQAAALPHAFADVDALLASPAVDIVAVTVRVPAHGAIVRAAIAAGKHVYCEWPLGNGLAEARELAEQARAAGILAVVGTQAIFAPEVVAARRLVREDAIGTLLSTSLIGTGGVLQGSGTIPSERDYGYLLDRANGASVLTIPAGHALAAVRSVLGEVQGLSAILATRRSTARVLDTGRTLPVTAPDQVVVSALLSGGVPLSLHYRGGDARAGDGLMWQIHGTEGDIRITGPSGHIQMVPLRLELAVGAASTFTPVAPVADDGVASLGVEAGNVARLWSAMACDLRHGTRTAPTFDDAVALHRSLDAIERASGDSLAP